MAFGYNAYNPQYYQPTAPQQMQGEIQRLIKKLDNM